MDLVFLVLAIGAGLILSRDRALLTTTVLWALCVAMVGWGPAHSDGVHTDTLGFWIPWAIVLALGLGLTSLVAYLRARRRDPRTSAET